MRHFVTTLSLILPFLVGAQTIATFENLDLPLDSFLNDSGSAPGFESGNVLLPNDYNPEFDAWKGWAISTERDTLSAGFFNQYSAITGGGAEGSSHYAVGFALEGIVIQLTNEAAGGVVEGLYLTNGTYPYLSMLNGDPFAKRFGGETGDDPDFFRLTIRKYQNGVLSTDSVDFYLADYRFEDNAEDYLIDEWTFVDLTALGNADSLHFLLASSDVGQFGMNTPAYFCIDHLTTGDIMVATTNPKEPTVLTIFPNPAATQITLDWPGTEQSVLEIYEAGGRRLRRLLIHPGINQIDIDQLPAGNYWLQPEGRRGQWMLKR